MRYILSLMILVLINSTANSAVRWVDGQPVFHKAAKTKKVYKKKRKYAKRSYRKKRRYYAKKKRIRRNRRTSWRPQSRVPRSGFTKFKGHKMPVSVANKLRSVEAKFGKIRIISSCRPGATVRKTGRPSMHRYCRAIDFKPRRGKYRQVARYLKTTWGGGVGTYSGRFNHIHIDDHRGRWHN